MTPWVEDAIARALKRLRGIMAEAADFPHITQNGKWQYTPDGVWTGGFWAGLLWLAWQSTHDA